MSVGRMDEASAMLDRALQHAIETDDVNLTSEILGFKAQIAWDGGQLGTMMGLRRAARRGGKRLYPGEAAIAAAQEARGYAVIDQARQRHAERPPWLYYQVDGFYELHRGQAWRHLGPHHPVYNARATTELSDGLGKLPADMRSSEWAGDFTYHLARAYMQADEHAEAERVAGELEETAACVGSDRVRRLAASLR
ncbi:hypothetical protein [Actinomadura sp. 7K507]|uniref:hypothetical protein n=1 Tax=Actinomadura sp. 7K507 TaxID=2530365 RepID=UPI0010E66BB6|nr:hypothetical protein [Actinomadura sp. 7K507]TDC80771.1 hypothetical protein E1285_34170 [Actinomadura sp. 7K507]